MSSYNYKQAFRWEFKFWTQIPTVFVIREAASQEFNLK
jgi:hypothetical protein